MARTKNNQQKGRQSAAKNGESSAQASTRATQLELPEGYQRTGTNNRTFNGSGRLSGSRNSNNMSNRAQVPGLSGITAPASYPKPWNMTKLYGVPIEKPGTLNFNYDRPWISLKGKNINEELATALKKGHRESLPPVFPDYTPAQKAEVREVYQKNGMLELFEARDNCNRNPPVIRGFLGGINPAMATTEAINATEFTAAPETITVAEVTTSTEVMSTTNMATSASSRTLMDILAVTELCREIVRHLHPSIRDITALAFSCWQAAPLVDRIMEVWNFTEEQNFADDYVAQYDNGGKLVKDAGVRNNILVITPITPEAPTPTPYQEVFKKTIRLTETMIRAPLSFRHIVLDRLQFLDVKMVDLVISSMPNLETMSISRCDLLDVTKLPELIDTIKRHPRKFGSKARGKALCLKNPTEGQNAEENNSQSAESSGSENTEANDAIANNASSSEDGNPSTSNDTSALTDSNTSQASTDTSATSVDGNDGDDHYIQLDFSPFFFRGPNTCKRLGSFGVVYNEPTFHTPKAVVSLMMRCWRDAEIIGMDLVSDSSSFFSFVRRLPGWDCLWTLKARDAMITFKRELRSLVLPQEFRRTVEREARAEILAENQGSRRLPSADFQDRVAARVKKLRKDKYDELKEELQHKLYDDLMAATSGDDFRPSENRPPKSLKVLRDHNAFGFWRRTHKCEGCKKELPRSLYAFTLDLCWGCKMVEFVKDMESSNLRRWKRSAIEQYLKDLDTKNGSLTDVLAPTRKEYAMKALKAVKTADAIWLKFMRFSLSDPVVYPPEPANLYKYTATYSRYRWKHNWPTEPFDYREGGPQHEDPFKHPNLDYHDTEMCGGEPPESFNARFQWSEAATQALFNAYIQPRGYAQRIDDPEAQRRIFMAKRWDKLRRIPNYRPKNQSENGMWFAGRDALRRDQNLKDKSIYIWIHGRVENYLWSLCTPLLRPFDVDHPFPDKRVDYEA